MMEFEIGDWVVDSEGDYCQVIDIGEGDDGYGDENSVWGFWSNHSDQKLHGEKDMIEFVFDNEADAKAIADLVKSNLLEGSV